MIVVSVKFIWLFLRIFFDHFIRKENLIVAKTQIALTKVPSTLFDLYYDFNIEYK